MRHAFIKIKSPRTKCSPQRRSGANHHNRHGKTPYLGDLAANSNVYIFLNHPFEMPNITQAPYNKLFFSIYNSLYQYMVLWHNKKKALYLKHAADRELAFGIGFSH